MIQEYRAKYQCKVVQYVAWGAAIQADLTKLVGKDGWAVPYYEGYEPHLSIATGRSYVRVRLGDYIVVAGNQVQVWSPEAFRLSFRRDG